MPPKGTRVRMTEALREMLRSNGSEEHTEEFGACEGVVLGPYLDWPDTVEVRWEPSGLKYLYRPDQLEVLA